MLSHFFAIAVTLFFVIDAFGNIPLYLSLLSKVPPKMQWKIALRELFFALGVMIVFFYVGEVLLSFLSIGSNTVKIAGGLMLFLIAIQFVFSEEESKEQWKTEHPFIVPIATPIIAGPSVLALIMIYAQDEPRDLPVLGAIALAWAASALVFLCAHPLFRLMGDKSLLAIQRLMGLIVAVFAVQMFLSGIKM